MCRETLTLHSEQLISIFPIRIFIKAPVKVNPLAIGVERLYEKVK